MSAQPGSDVRDAVAIVGVGRTPMSKASGKSTAALAVEAIAAAVSDAGLKASDIDGLATHHVNDSASVSDLAHALGLKELRWFHEELGGGSKAPAVLANAARACLDGSATTVVVYRSLNGRSGRRMGSYGGGLAMSLGDMQYQIPYGLMAPAQLYAMGARMHMNRFGTTESQFGAIAVQQRENASKNPLALMHTPITIEDYLASRWIVEPFRLLDCCLESDGACAVILTLKDRAAQLRAPLVTLRAWASALGPNGFSNTEGDLTETTARLVAQSLYSRAGLGPEDIDVAQLYDAFTYAVLVQLEDYGFCPKGQGGPFIEAGHTRLTGQLPVNTHGGFLSEGYVHGLNHIAEATLQLRGEAGARQVPGCETALVTAQPGYITGLSSAVILRRS